MELTITSMTPADRLYAYNQSSQLEGQTGCIGHLRGDFGAGKEFYTSWFDHRREYKTDEFKAELDEVVNTLREKNGLLCTRDSMTRFCYQNPEAEFEGNYCAEYGFKVQTPQHTYMLRCNPNYGDYNFYLYAYVSRFLEHHMEKAKQGMGTHKIAAVFREEQVPCPSWWLHSRGEKDYSKRFENPENKYEWSHTVIRNIISNPLYLGHE